MPDPKPATRILDALTRSPKNYQVTYRISEKTTTTGTSDKRYGDLVSRLGGLAGVEPGRFEGKGHTSTSAWIVSYDGTAADLFDALKSAVTARFDMLEIIEVVIGNEARLPPAINA